MCLSSDTKLTEQKLDYFKKHNIKEIIVWKVLVRYKERYLSPYFNMEYKIGKNIPVKTFKNFIWADGLIEKGVLHSFISRTIVRRYALLYECEQVRSFYAAKFTSKNGPYPYKIIRCRVKVKDIIAYGENDDIAVKALYIDKFSERK